MNRRALLLVLGLWVRSILPAALTGACGPGHVESAAREGAATSHDRPLVVEFSATWCGPCKYFEKYTMVDERVKRALEDVRFVRIDGDREPGEARRYGVTGYPTFVVVSERGKVVAQMKGALGAVKFIDFIQWGAPNAFEEAVIARQMAVRPSVRGLLFQARLHAMKGHTAQAVAAYRRALSAATDERRKADIEWELALLESAGGTAAVLAARAAKFAVEHPTAANALGAAEVALVSGTLPPEEVKALAARLLAVYANDREPLNDIAYALLAAHELDEALAVARRQVELAPAEANPYDTLAEVHHHRGERPAALENVDRAIALAKQGDLRARFEANRARFAAAKGDAGSALDATRQRVELILLRYHIAR